MNPLLEAIRYVYQFDSIIDTDHNTYLYGTILASGHRYLILLSDEPRLNQRVAQEAAATKTARAARWLARAADIRRLPGTTADSDKIDRTILIKTTPGAAEMPPVEPDGLWEYLHLNDVLSRLVLGFPSLAAVAKGHHLDKLEEPLVRLVKRQQGGVVQPTLEEVNGSEKKPLPGSAVAKLIDWVRNPGGHPFAVIFGLGGLGKTTLLELVGRSLWEGFTRYEHSHIPAYVPLGGMPAGATYGLASHITSFPLFWQRSAASIDALVRAGVLVVFLDAFDEHLKFANRDDAVRFLRSLRQRYGVSVNAQAPRLLLTSRDYYLHTDRLFDQELGDLAVRYRLRPFDAIQRRDFIRLHTRGRDGFTEEKALQWADALEEQVARLKRGQPTVDIDSLVGHSLFLLAFCDYISRPERRQNRVSSRVSPVSPDEFRLHSVGLFDEVIGLINEREARDKSKWDDTIYRDLKPEWHVSPFTVEKQNHFFAEATKLMVLREGKVPEPVRVRPHLAQVEKEIAEAMKQAALVPEASNAVTERRVREEIERIAFNHIVSFLSNHPLVDSNGSGFDGNSLFAFRHEAYQDYFVKQYLSQRFRFLVDGMKVTPYGRALNDDVAVQLDDLITELYSTRLLDRATNALYFLCWDDQALEDLSSALRALFVSPAELGLKTDVFSMVLQYSLLFARLYWELRGKPAVFEGLYLHPGGDTQVLITGEDFNQLLNGLTLSLCSLGHVELSNVTLKNCHFLSLSVRHLGFRGNVTFDGGRLYLIPEDEDQTLDKCLYITDGEVTLHLKGVQVHTETLNALRELDSLYPNFHLVEDCVEILEDEEEDDRFVLSPGRRFVNTMMRLMRKHERPEFGVYSRKLLGRTGVPRDRENQALEVLIEAGIIGRSGDMLIMKDPAFMYHPSGLHGRTWEQVEHLWAGLIDRIDEVLEYGQSARAGD
jgi:hypothetical protein